MPKPPAPRAPPGGLKPTLRPEKLVSKGAAVVRTEEALRSVFAKADKQTALAITRLANEQRKAFRRTRADGLDERIPESPTPPVTPVASDGTSVTRVPQAWEVRGAQTAGIEVPGGSSDEVTVELGGMLVMPVVSYDVQFSVFAQPAAFRLSLAAKEPYADLFKVVYPRSPFVFRVNRIPVQRGYVDGWSVGGHFSTVEVHGRDFTQDIHEAYLGVEYTFRDTTHKSFIESVISVIQLEPAPEVRTTTAAARRAMITGRPVPPSSVVEENTIHGPIHATLGDRGFDLVKRVLDRAGLFMMGGPDGKIYITAPSPNLKPSYRLTHSRPNGRANVEDFKYSVDTRNRCTHYVVYARGGGGGKRDLHVKFRGTVADPEMLGRGYKRPHTFRDWHVKSTAQCELMARRKIAEQRRRSWQLQLTVPGHTTRTLNGEIAVWHPDTALHFESEVMGISDTFYIESVTFRRSSDGTFTDLRLMRMEDLLFGSEEIEE